METRFLRLVNRTLRLAASRHGDHSGEAVEPPPADAGTAEIAQDAGTSLRVTHPLVRPEVAVMQDGQVIVDCNWKPTDVTAQFIEDAATYHARYFDRLDFQHLVGRMLDLAAVPRDAPLSVLDIGSGGGSSVFAALKLMPRAKVAASDISPTLLAMLADFSAARDDVRDRVAAFCFDLHDPFFREASFDLVIGCAILHHLTDPHAALRHVAASLKPGGRIVLCEPLEAGNLVNLFIYDTIISLERRDGPPADPRLMNLMQAMRLDLQARQGPPREKPWTRALDDKWIFDASYLSELAAGLGCAAAEIHPAQEDLGQVFETSLRSLLADSGNADVVLSDAVAGFLREVDRDIGMALKRKLCPTGIIVMTKRA